MDTLQYNKQQSDQEEDVAVKGKPAIIAEDNPFTDQDIQVLRDESNLSSDDRTWKRSKATKFGEVWKKSSDSLPVQKMKGCLLFPGIPPTTVLELITNFELRVRWEKQFRVFEVLEEHDDYKIIYWRVKTPKGTTDRDFVMYVTHGVDSNGVYYVLYKNATHPKRPEIPGVIRAENIFSGSLIYPDKDSPTDSTRVFVLAEDDLKGTIPKIILNLFYSKAPLDWRDNLDNFYHKIYKHEISS